MYIYIYEYIYVHICMRCWLRDGTRGPILNKREQGSVYSALDICMEYINRHGDTVGISGDTVGIPEAPLRYPHPVVGRASVGARASCPLIPSHACAFR